VVGGAEELDAVDEELGWGVGKGRGEGIGQGD
jgi:hypothetical protein